MLYHLFLLSSITSPWPRIYPVHTLWKIILHWATFTRRRKQQPTPVLLLGKSHGRRSLVGCSPRGCKELQRVRHWATSLSLSCLLSIQGIKRKHDIFQKEVFFFYAISAATFLQDNVHNNCYEYLELKAHFKNQSFTLIDVPTYSVGWLRKKVPSVVWGC